jgi:hypothetical protein
VRTGIIAAPHLGHAGHRIEAVVAVIGSKRSAGFLTSAAARGASIFKLMDVSRHKSVDTLRGYVGDADAFRDHTGAGLL